MLLTAVVVGWGLFVRARREVIFSLRERAARLEAEQRLRVEQARDAERRRIAREMHDVLAHRVSLLTLHAGALEFRPDASPEEVAEAAGVIRATAHAALEDLRGVIGVLRDGEGGDGPEPPQPTLADIPALVEESRAAGMKVECSIGEPPGPVPDALGRTAYRVVQEGLTNARKHAPAAAVAVHVGPDGRGRARGPGDQPAPARRGGGRAARGARHRQRADRARRARRARRRRAAPRPGRGGRLRAPRDAAGMSIRVLLVDDDPLVRSGLRMLLAGADTLAVVGEADDGRGVLAAVDLHRPDVVLMDIRMPQLDGIEATRLLRAQPDPPAVVVLTTFDADEDVLSALRAGAAGFLLKDTPPAELVRAIELVHAGDSMLSPQVTRRLIALVAGDGEGAARARRARERLETLTAREREVALAVGAGRANAEIAAELHMSVATVKAHVSRLLAKLEAENRIQVALLVQDATGGRA